MHKGHRRITTQEISCDAFKLHSPKWGRQGGDRRLWVEDPKILSAARICSLDARHLSSRYSHVPRQIRGNEGGTQIVDCLVLSVQENKAISI